MFRKKIKYLLWGILTFFILMVSSCFIIVNVYKDEVKQYIIKELKASSNNTIMVGSIGELTFFKYFPNLTISLNKVVVLEQWNMEERSELLKAEQIGFQLNLMKLLKDEISIQKMFFENGTVFIRENEKGAYNFLNNADTSTSELLVDIRAIELSNMGYEYTGADGLEIVSGKVRNLKLMGNFQEPIISFKSNGKISTLLRENGYVRSDLKELSYVFEGNYVRAKSKMENFQLNVQYEDLKATINGGFELNDSSALDIRFNLEESDLDKLWSIMSDSVAHHVQKYGLNGLVKTDGNIKGNIGKGNVPEVVIHVRANKLGAKLSDQYTLEDGELELRFANMSSSNLDHYSLNVEHAKFKLNGYFLKVKGGVKNFNKPIIHFDLNEKLDAAALNLLLDGTDLKLSGGTVMPHITGIIYMDSKADSNYIKEINLTGHAVGEEIELIYNDTLPRVKMKKGKFAFREKELNIDECTGVYGSSELSVSGRIQDYMTSNRYLMLKVDVQNLNTKDVLISSSSHSEPVELPQMSVDLSVAHLVHHKIELRDVMVHVDANEQKIQLKKGTVNLFDGEGTFNGDLNFSEQMKVSGNVSLRSIDMKTLFEQTQNFEQDVIRSEHISGRADIASAFAFSMKEGYLDYKTLRVEADLTLEKGVLKNVETFDEICNYIEEKKLYGAFIDHEKLRGKLKNIQFTTLSNSILIENEMVMIPNMHIGSSAMDINLAGTHSFKHDLNYQFDFYLSEILKKKEAKLEDGEWEVYEDKREWFRMPIKVTGTVDDPIFTLNRKSALKQVGEELDKQPKVIKGLLKEGFSKGALDSNRKEDDDAKPDLEFYHPEFNPPQEKDPGLEKKETKKPKKKKGWLNLEQNKKETEEVDVNDL